MNSLNSLTSKTKTEDLNFEKDESDNNYDYQVETLTKYMQIETLIYTKSGQKYAPYKKVNQDLYSPLKFNNTILVNDHEIKELKFNLSDAVLEGSGDSVDLMQEAVNQFILTFDRNQLGRDSFFKCIRDKFCGGVVNSSESDILTYYYDKAYDDISSASTQNEFSKANQEASRV